jgi:hypothetical protein
VIVLHRLSAATLVVVLMLLPAALERCRAVCIGHHGPAVMAATAHACHDMASGDEDGARMDPLPAACGHDEPGRTPESAGVAPLKPRSDGAAMAALLPVPAAVPALVRPTASVARQSSPTPPSLLSTLKSPLRL